MNISQVNKSMFSAAQHLLEAAKYLSDTGFQQEGVNLMILADNLVNTIIPEEPKISEEKMNSIMDEIINYGN